jgi:hypothetical protein
MRRLWLALIVFAAGMLFVVGAGSQPPGGEGRPGKKGRTRGGFRLGGVLPPHVRNNLDLTDAQEKQIAALEKEVKSKLEKILTAEQVRQVERAGPPGPRRRPDGPPPEDEPVESPARPRSPAEKEPEGLVKNSRFTQADKDGRSPAHYRLSGGAVWGRAGMEGEITDQGVALRSNQRAGAVSQDVTGFVGGAGKWFRFTFRGLPEKNFSVKEGGLFMRVAFFGKKGGNPLDGVTRKLDGLIQRDRKELAVNGNHRVNGAAVWKTYALEFRLPFNEIDLLRLTVGSENGTSTTEKDCAFHVSHFALVPIASPDSAPRLIKTPRGREPSLKSLIHLGGRWYYDPEPGLTKKPATLTVTAKNAHRLFYRDIRLTNPFAENMTAWLRAGYKDVSGRIVKEDRFISDNVVLIFDNDKTMTVRARNIPNHPTALFPERYGNPSYIQELDATYHIPLNPVRKSKSLAIDKRNTNRALPMGAIAIAINGVVFYNPFDASSMDATSIMDRCCGHPSPDNRYHYHKYPVCVKSPFVDEGDEHSPLIGFAFDGFPIYGPYESKGVMAKDLKTNALDELNMHYDEERGWHYHVTPGKFPYVIGGYAGETDARNFPRRRPRR